MPEPASAGHLTVASHALPSAALPQKVTRAMVKEFVDHERQAAKEKPISVQLLYKSHPKPDWWPTDVDVSVLLCAA